MLKCLITKNVISLLTKKKRLNLSKNILKIQKKKFGLYIKNTLKEFLWNMYNKSILLIDFLQYYYIYALILIIKNK